MSEPDRPQRRGPVDRQLFEAGSLPFSGEMLGCEVVEDAAGVSVSRGMVRAFQLRRQHLHVHAEGDGALSEVAGACGVQDSPPGSAAVALAARVEGVTAQSMEDALVEDRTLVRTWAMRGAPFVVPTVDLPVYTTGVLPPTEEARTNLIYGVRESLAGLSLGVDELTALAAEAVTEVLAGERLDINELGRRVADLIGPTLSDDDRDAWTAEGPHAKGQPVGEAVVHFCVRLLTLQRLLCFAPREGRQAPFVLVSEWLDEVPPLDGDVARRELARRYLRTYGPSSRAGLAAWLGVNSSDATSWWDLVQDEVTPVDLEGARRWILSDDLETLTVGELEQIRGARLLPPGDPLLQVPDREFLVDDPDRQRQLWRPLHAPGAALVDGDVVGVWRSRKTSRSLEVTVEGFRPLTSHAQDELGHEADVVARMRGQERATVVFPDPS